MRTLILALEYHGAAHAVDQVQDYKRGDGDTFRPAMFLLGQSIELALKAYLRMHGLSRGKLRNEYGHNLRRLLRLAEKRGLDIRPLTADDRASLIDANVLYSKKLLQYAQPTLGHRHYWPDFDQLSRLAAVIIYRAVDATAFAYFLLLQDHATPVLRCLKELNSRKPEHIFRLPELISLEELIERSDSDADKAD